MVDDAFIGRVSVGETERAARFLHLGISVMAARHGKGLVDDELRGAVVMMAPVPLPASPAANARMLPGADADGSATYLETGDHGPQGLYESRGFERLERLEDAADLPPIVTTWRPAR